MSLESKSLEELKAIAKELDIKVHHMAKGPSIIANINKQQPHRIEAAIVAATGAVEKAKEPAPSNKAEEVEKALEALKNRVPEFESIYPDDGTWIFRCKGAEESGNLDIPLRVIMMKANFISRGRRAMRTMGRADEDKTYAGTILTV